MYSVQPQFNRGNVIVSSYFGETTGPFPVLFFQEPTEKTNIEMFQEFKTLPFVKFCGASEPWENVVNFINTITDMKGILSKQNLYWTDETTHHSVPEHVIYLIIHIKQPLYLNLKFMIKKEDCGVTILSI